MALSGQKKAATVNELNTRCQNSCTNYLLANDLENKTNFNNLCQEECRNEMDRIASLMSQDQNLDVENTYQGEFYLKYKEQDTTGYNICQKDLGTLSGLGDYSLLYTEEAYECDEGYLVTPFPYVSRNEIIEKVPDAKALLFHRNGGLLQVCNNTENCTSNCKSRNLCESVLLSCGDKHCQLLEAIRTGNPARCDQISIPNQLPTDLGWIEQCEVMIEERKFKNEADTPEVEI